MEKRRFTIIVERLFWYYRIYKRNSVMLHW